MLLDTIDAGYKRDPHRTRSAADTLAWLAPRKAEFGITRIANVTGLDRIGIPVVLVTRPNSRSVAVSQGKGATIAAAKVSALMEAVELWHAENIVQPVFFASHRDLAGQHAIVDVDRLPRAAGSRYVPDLRLHWIAGRDLMADRAVLVPYEMVTADYTHPVPPGYGCFFSSTNGLASGRHLLEAVCYAILEVIERDSVALWYHSTAERRAAARIHPATIDAAAGRTLWSMLEDAGLEVALWEATSDVGVATFHCLIVDRTEADGHIGLGSGAHSDREEALTRALTEAAQTRLNYITGARDDLEFAEFLPHGRKVKATAAQDLLRLGPPARDFTTAPSKRNATFRDDLDWLLERLAGVGVDEVAMVELSGAAQEYAVVRVVVPGLEAPHDDQGYVPGARAAALRDLP